MIVNPEGEYIGSYRKHNLWITDKSWAVAGEAF
jgi:predicted amidohydrolase